MPNPIFKRYIVVRGQYEGYHRYENAPDKVAFLRNVHRHIFKWAVEIEVSHNDRELEFFLVQQDLNRLVLPFTQLGELGSCEMQAERIANGVLNLYGYERYFNVTVSEDGENDGIVEYRPEDQKWPAS